MYHLPQRLETQRLPGPQPSHAQNVYVCGIVHKHTAAQFPAQNGQIFFITETDEFSGRSEMNLCIHRLFFFAAEQLCCCLTLLIPPAQADNSKVLCTTDIIIRFILY